jgi:excinuclease UvrABC helicase subunit UvrB
VGKDFPRDELVRRLVEIQYERNDIDFHRGTFRVRGDIVEIFPPYEDEEALRIEFFGDTIESMSLIDPLRGKKISAVNKTAVYPGSHYVTSRENLKRATADIRAELALTLTEYREQAAGSAKTGAAHQLRSGDDGGDGLLPGDRKLFPPFNRTQARPAAADINGVSAS